MAKLVKKLCPACGQMKKIRTDCKTCGCKGAHPTSKSADQKAEIELEKQRIRHSGKDSVISSLTSKIIHLEKEVTALTSIADKTPQIINILPKVSSHKSESAAVMNWSDWHIEERVLPGQVGGRNEYNTKIRNERFHALCQGTLAWFGIENAKTTIKTFVLALLGDFITGSIHADLAEANILPPAEAIYEAQNMLMSGIKFLRYHLPSDVEIIVVCHSGNHGRMTVEQRIATETGNSLECYMYYALRDVFQNTPKVRFLIATGYHSVVSFFEDQYKVRFHHGHQVRYQGGVGGVTIPANKAIAQWNCYSPVNLDVFGHHHQRFDGGTFICNGSLMGYNAYAVAIKARFEKPSQTFFLINREHAEKTMVAPVFV